MDINRIILATILTLQVLLVWRVWTSGGPEAPVGGGGAFSGSDNRMPHAHQAVYDDLTSPAKKGAKATLPKKANAAAAKSPTFAMGSMNDHETSYDHIAISNKMRYAKKHGYELVLDLEPNHSFSKDWDRLSNMETIIRGKLKGDNQIEWIWWSDYDLIVTNSSITLASIVEEALDPADESQRNAIDLIVAPDCFPMNSGSLFLRTTPWALDFIAEMWRQKDMRGGKENRADRSLQDCLGDLVLDKGIQIDRKSVFVKQWKINAFPPEIKCHEDDRPWGRGDFAIHFAGAWAHVEGDDPTGRLMRKYAPEAF